MSALTPLVHVTNIPMDVEVEKAVRAYKKHYGIADETSVYVEIMMIMDRNDNPVVQIQVGGQPDPTVEGGRLL